MALRDTASLSAGLLVLLLTWGAWADVVVNMEDKVEVNRGESAQITCMFTSEDGIGGMVIEWSYVTRTGRKQKIFYQDTTMRDVVRGTPFTDRISVNGTGETVVLTIDEVEVADEVEFICLVKSLTDGVGEGRTQLKVFEKPDVTTIEGVRTGILVNIGRPSKIGTCEVKNGFPRPNITWYRDGVQLRNGHGGVKVLPTTTTESTGLVSVSSELSMVVRKEDNDVKFHCEVSYFVPGGTRMIETKTINITAYYPSTAVRVWVESPKGKIKEGDSVEIHCRGNGNSPSSDCTLKHEDKDLRLENNMLVLNNVTRLNSGVYGCICFDMETFDEISGNTSVFVNYLDPAQVVPKDAVEVARGKQLKATCNALSSLQTHTTWFKEGKEVSKGHTLTLNDATLDTAGTYVCMVTVPEIEGMETSGTLRVHVQAPPNIINPQNTEMEESSGNTVVLSCDVRGFPAPSVTWTTADGKVLKTTSHKKTEDGVRSEVSLRVTSDITAFCNASNEHGTDAVAFNIKAKGSGVIIAVIIICILLLAVLGSVLYYLYKKGKICGRSDKQDLTKEKSNKDNIVVEMKSDNPEEAVLLGVNGEKQPPSHQ